MNSQDIISIDNKAVANKVPCKTCLDFNYLNKIFQLNKISDSDNSSEIRLYSVTSRDIGVIIIKSNNDSYSAKILNKPIKLVHSIENPTNTPFKEIKIDHKNIDSVVNVMLAHNIFKLKDQSEISTFKGQNQILPLEYSIQTKLGSVISQFGFNNIISFAKNNPEVEEFQDYLAILSAFGKLTPIENK